ncbi:unnamed protein product [Heterobilharzia americana]|nr:unnamed protein product [Heterobilharzia americana]
MKFSKRLRNLPLLSSNRLHRILIYGPNKKCAPCLIFLLLTIIIYFFLTRMIFSFLSKDVVVPAAIFIPKTTLSSISTTTASQHYPTNLATHSGTPYEIHSTTPKTAQIQKVKTTENQYIATFNSSPSKRPNFHVNIPKQNRITLKNLFPPLYPNSSFCLKKTRFYIDDKKVNLKTDEGIINLIDALMPSLNMNIWSKIEPYICQSSKTNLLIITFSPSGSYSVRNKIRQTWGSVKYILSETTNEQYPNGLKIIEHLFIVNISKSRTVQNSVEFPKLINEAEKERDILPLPLTGLQNNYASLHILASEFLLHHCKKAVDFVLFINEDLFPNLNALVQYTTSKKLQLQSNSLKHNNPRIYCIPIEKKHVEYKPHLRYDSKNKLSEWIGKLYPTHCDIEASGFLMLFETLKRWYTCARIYKPFNPISIYLTGLLSHAAKIEIESYWTNYWSTGYLLPSMALNKKSKRYLFFKGSVNQSNRVWKSVFRAILGQ